MIPQFFDNLIRDNFFDLLFSLNFVNPPHRAFQNVIFLLQPGKETGNIAPDIDNRCLAALIDLLIIRKIGTNLLRGDPSDGGGDTPQQMFHRHTIVSHMESTLFFISPVIILKTSKAVLVFFSAAADADDLRFPLI